MKRLLILSAAMTLFSISALAEKWTGYISDEKCAVSGSKAAKASEWVNPKAFEGCAKKCVKAGDAIVFVTEDNKILRFEAASIEKAAAHVGHKVSLTGKVENDKLQIEKIEAIPMP